MKYSERLNAVATGILTSCALVITAMLVRREFFTSVHASGGMPGASEQSDWADFARAGHAMGPSNAKVTIVEFGDFECPYCRRFSVLADSLRLRGKSFRVVYRHFPLNIHRFAIPAARASECAAQQGKFDEMYSVLYAHPDSLGLAPWSWFGRQAHVPDSKRFEGCIEDRGPVPALARDTVDGNRLAVKGTPTLLIGSLRLGGVPSLDSLSAFIDRASMSGARSGKATQE